ncbi:MAG: cell division protein SepF [Fimbriimonadales bacterium]|nr:cell division protein SepF [Fimbriimonadales bacterium]
MEELEVAQRPGLFEKLFDRFRSNDIDEEEADAVVAANPGRIYHITVRRQVVTFADAVAAADGLKRSEQQILNLCSADSQLREKIKDFLAGVNYAQEGTWEELGEHVYLLAPSNARVETAPATPRIAANQN